MNGDPLLLLRLLAALAISLAATALLAKALRRPLRAEIALTSVALPVLLLLPWLTGSVILLPTGNLAGGIPGTGLSTAAEPYSRTLNDVSLLLAPWEMEVRRHLASGRLPFWSDLIDGGSSPWADPQTSVLAPTSVLARLLPIQHHFLAALALKIQLAVVGTWVAGRAWGLRRRSAWLAATGFGVSGGILAWGLFPISAAAAWAPWCLAAVRRLARRSDKGLLVATTAIVAGLLLSGQPETAFGVGLMSGLFLLLHARRRARVRALVRLAAAGSLAFALSAPVVLPFLAIVGDSQRAFDRSLEQTQPPSPQRFRVAPTTLAVLRAPFSPWAAGVPFTTIIKGGENVNALSAYAGLLTIAGIACLVATPSLWRRGAALVAFWALVLALGAELPYLIEVWKHLPVLHIVTPRNQIPLATLALVLAGGIGLDRMLRASRVTRVWLLAALTAALAACFAVAPERGVAIVGVAVVAAALLAPRASRIAAVVLALALLGDQIRWGRHLLPPGDPRLFYPKTPEIEELVARAGGPGGRAVGNAAMAYPAILSTFGLSDPRIHNPMASRRYRDTLAAAFGFEPTLWSIFGVFRNPEHPFLDFLGVRAVLSNYNLPPVRGMRELPLRPPYVVFLNGGALPRRFLTDRFDLIDRERLRDWIRSMKDPRRVALLREEMADRIPAQGFRAGRLRILSSEPGAATIRVPLTRTKLLATSYRGPAGWTARGEKGERLDTITVNGAFLGVVVPPHVRTVRLRFRPPGWYPGLALAALAAFALASHLVIARSRGGRRALEHRGRAQRRKA